jgi:hypothetical protein
VVANPAVVFAPAAKAKANPAKSAQKKAGSDKHGDRSRVKISARKKTLASPTKSEAKLTTADALDRHTKRAG